MANDLVKELIEEIRAIQVPNPMSADELCRMFGLATDFSNEMSPGKLFIKKQKQDKDSDAATSSPPKTDANDDGASKEDNSINDDSPSNALIKRLTNLAVAASDMVPALQPEQIESINNDLDSVESSMSTLMLEKMQTDDNDGFAMGG
ncbi:hypothetical protein FQN54_008181 [Arachnomyces sp. PD_36]|nr:hypothetical protein FQN54_008181 [Arachnomyces sp. PD_36]